MSNKAIAKIRAKTRVKDGMMYLQSGVAVQCEKATPEQKTQWMMESADRVAGTISSLYKDVARYGLDVTNLETMIQERIIG